jgi:hypothetical protein
VGILRNLDVPYLISSSARELSKASPDFQISQISVKKTLQADPSAACEVAILEEDLLKVLDRWKLAARIA